MNKSWLTAQRTGTTGGRLMFCSSIVQPLQLVERFRFVRLSSKGTQHEVKNPYRPVGWRLRKTKSSVKRTGQIIDPQLAKDLARSILEHVRKSGRNRSICTLL